MLKENKGKLILSSILIMVPTILGFLMWDKLPDTMVSHFGLDGTADGYSTKLFVITVPFLCLLAGQWICLYFTGKDQGNKNQNRKVTGMLYWIMPIISIFIGGQLYSITLGYEINPANYMMPLIGILFIVIGNYMPKCKQNSTIGIKIPWTLKNEENWNMTHRLGGKVWVIGGFILLFTMFVPAPISTTLFFAGIFLLIIIPFVYSYRYYLKQKQEGTWVASTLVYDEKSNKSAAIISAVIIIASLILVVFVTFTGDIRYEFEDDSFKIEADYWSDVTVKYENIESISYRDNVRPGDRVGGFGSPRLGLGNFENREFGPYTRYCYEKCKECVVLEIGGKMLVINGEDEAATKVLYEKLLNCIQ